MWVDIATAIINMKKEMRRLPNIIEEIVIVIQSRESVKIFALIGIPLPSR